MDITVNRATGSLVIDPTTLTNTTIKEDMIYCFDNSSMSLSRTTFSKKTFRLEGVSFTDFFEKD